MNFGQALEAIKSGKPVARSGWNGSGQLVYLNAGSVDRKGEDAPQANVGRINGIAIDLFRGGDTGTVTRMPNFNIKTAQGATAVWVPSTTDVLAEDWLEV